MSNETTMSVSVVGNGTCIYLIVDGHQLMRMDYGNNVETRYVWYSITQEGFVDMPNDVNDDLEELYKMYLEMTASESSAHSPRPEPQG